VTARAEVSDGDQTPALSGSAHRRLDPQVSPVAVGVIVWLASELMFFSGLFAAYFTLRAKTAVWPPVDVELETGRAAVATAVLVLSSGTMHLAAVGAARGGRQRSAVQWLGATLALGSVFIGNQLLEYIESSFSISSHAYGSMFFLMTGFHGLHVIGGLVFMGGAIWMVSGRSRAPLLQSIEMCGYYWHFVDVVWVVMFANLYLLQ
jgi:cytochrome c oxidase subunit III